jgi:hypothetical protein
MLVIAFVRGCLILHNLIIQLGEADIEFQEQLVAEGHFRVLDAVEDRCGDPYSVLQQVETEGQKFRRQVMTVLFDSLSSTAVRRP